MAINSRQQQKRDYEYNWMLAAGSFFPLRGEIIIYEAEAIKNSDGTITPINGAMIPIDRDFRYTYPRFKVGDGIHAVDKLPFLPLPGEGDSDSSSIPVVNATSTDGQTYTATIDNFDIATNKVIILIPNMNSSLGPEVPAPVLKINGDATGAEIRYSIMGSYSEADGMPNTILRANCPIMLGYDGTYWRPSDQMMNASWISGTLSIYNGGTGATTAAQARSNLGITNLNLGQGYGTCSTAASTKAKAVTMSSYVLSTGGIVSVKFTYAVPASATMNINSKGAKSIYYKGAAIAADVIQAGDIATFMYDGTRYHLLTVDTWNTDSYNFITTADIDTICSSTIQFASADGGVTF